MQRVFVRGLRAFSFGLIVVLGLAAYMYSAGVPPGSDVGRALFFASVAAGFSLGLLLRGRRESQRLFSLAILPIPIAVLVIALFSTFPDYRYSEVFDHVYTYGTGPILLLSSFLSSFVLPFLFTVRRNSGLMAADAIEKQTERCNECGRKLRSTWQACPHCGAQVEQQDAELPRACPSCRKVVEPKWVRCPYCSASLATETRQDRTVCLNCGESVKPGWKKCPYCATHLVP